MADLTFFQEEFDRHATHGALGDPNGTLGYAYLRVSTSAQAEEGRYGLPRQIARVSEVAAKEQICIPWDYVFADDHTGFQFHDRPELSKLRAEYTRPDRQANTVAIEYLDRLSRNADWHQGFLLDEMKQHHIRPLFWKGFTSRVERAVMGAVSQDGMERTLEIMQEGIRDKARSGRVTARVAAYGYRFVDSEGKPSPKARKETYYGPHPQHGEVIQTIYYKIGIEGEGTYTLCQYLEDRFPPPSRYAHWLPTTLRKIIRNPLYKGEFYANRLQKVAVPAKKQTLGEPVKMTMKDVERPREDWILVPVPPLVSVELWEAANAMLDKHSQMAKRNGRLPYLLTGLVRCDECRYAYAGKRKKNYRGTQAAKKRVNRYYCCSERTAKSHYDQLDTECTQSQISAPLLEDEVWNAVCEFVNHPQQLIERINAQLEDESHAGLHQQIAFLEKQIAGSEKEDEKLYRAFMADVFDEEEYAARRRLLKEKVATWQREREELAERVISREQVEAEKATILEFAAYAKEEGITTNTSFTFKQRMLKLLVDKITLNVNEGWFEIKGRVSGVWLIRKSDSSSPFPTASPVGAVGGYIRNTSPSKPFR